MQPMGKGIKHRSAHFFKALLQIIMSNQQDTVLQDIKVIYVEGLRYTMLNLNVSGRKNALHFKDGLMSVRNLSITSALPQFIL